MKGASALSGPRRRTEHCFAELTGRSPGSARVSEELLRPHGVSILSLLQERAGGWSSCPPVPVLSAQLPHPGNRTGMALTLKSDPPGFTPSPAASLQQMLVKYLLL